MFYKELEEQYKTPTNCQLEIEREYKRKWSRKISDAATQDTNSKLGAYYEINPDCDNIQYDKLHELERITITRYRTGSHNLRIETGRHTNPITPREQRLCACGTEIQTLKHIAIESELLQELRDDTNFTNVNHFFKWNGAVTFLMKASAILKIEL